MPVFVFSTDEYLNEESSSGVEEYVNEIVPQYRGKPQRAHPLV